MRDCPMRNRLLDAACTLAPGLPSQSALTQRCPVQRGHNVDVGIADDLMAAICQLRTHIPGGCGAHLSAFARRLSLHPASAARRCAACILRLFWPDALFFRQSSLRYRLASKREQCACRSEEHTSELQSPDHLVCR